MQRVQWKRVIVTRKYSNASEFEKEGKERRLHAYYRKQRFNLNRVIARYPKEFHRISVHLYRGETARGTENSYRVNLIKPIACLRTEIVQVRGEYSRLKHLDASRSIRLKVISPPWIMRMWSAISPRSVYFFPRFFRSLFVLLLFRVPSCFSLYPLSIPFVSQFFPALWLFLFSLLSRAHVDFTRRARLCILARSLVFASCKFQRLHFARHVRVGYLRRSLVAAFPRRILFRGFTIVLWCGDLRYTRRMLLKCMPWEILITL